MQPSEGLAFFLLCSWMSDILYKIAEHQHAELLAGLVFLHLASIFTRMGALDSGLTPLKINSSPLKINGSKMFEDKIWDLLKLPPFKGTC